MFSSYLIDYDQIDDVFSALLSDSSSLISITFILHNCKSNTLDVNCHFFFKCGIGIKIFTVTSKTEEKKNSFCEWGSFSSFEIWGGGEFFQV